MLYIHLTKPEPGSRGGRTARATAAARRRQAEKTKTTESLKGKARHRPDGRPGRSRFYARKTFGTTFYGNDCNPLPAGHTPKKMSIFFPRLFCPAGPLREAVIRCHRPHGAITDPGAEQAVRSVPTHRPIRCPVVSALIVRFFCAGMQKGPARAGTGPSMAHKAVRPRSGTSGRRQRKSGRPVAGRR